ncbi:hypothetical protein HYE02_00885 [Mycoplasmopsis bovis]|nr:hypothetical protein [Mycoplasmopsis bovis]QQH28221.1 hypothetical protein HYE02_00885 [Mycoplasmopsis bovis]
MIYYLTKHCNNCFKTSSRAFSLISVSPVVEDPLRPTGSISFINALASSV